MPTPRVTVWPEAPEVGIPELPAVLFDSGDVFLAYETPKKGTYAVIRFTAVIDHRLSPIYDEGLGKHPYAKFGLKWYSFHEVLDSKEALAWSVLRARHWVVTFKDVTLDVIATGVVVITRELAAASPLVALQFAAARHEKKE